MTAIIVPDKIETSSVRRGRAIIMQITNAVGELHDKGKNPQKIQISTALKDDLLAFFDYAYDFDGVLPKEFCGLPIEYEPGAGRRIHITCQS